MNTSNLLIINDSGVNLKSWDSVSNCINIFSSTCPESPSLNKILGKRI